MKIVTGNWGESDVSDTREVDGGGVSVDCGGAEFILFDGTDAAGDAARQYWQNMADHDPEEFRCMVGDETLVAWAMGQCAGPGTTQVKSLEEWLDLWLDTPEEYWAAYDGNEDEAMLYFDESEEDDVAHLGDVIDNPDYDPEDEDEDGYPFMITGIVCYRWN